jgi:hypothetical protein
VIVLIAASAAAQTDRSAPVQTVVACKATSSTLALANNEARNLLTFQNDSDTDIYVTAGATAATGTGWRVVANGGGWFFDSKVPIGALYCIHGATGNKSLLVTEGSK